ncbi:TIGR03435 family protein [Terriglobus roseus]|uniref:Soil-associated protein, TIGR03435 family n=1 Tax=Terriglobus roseus TaxID=392734 RepID=A0A1G7PXE1_9BACT|nr:TIGR03435 family protein [Terriglobus roseus]SDF90926.1 soil-associated protein, TIGR03435 family [Terriglobus roseus]
MPSPLGLTSATCKSLLALLLLSAAPVGISAQKSDHPSFAVTSVKPYVGETPAYELNFDGGHAEMTRITVADMIRHCYRLTTNDQIVNLPDWAKKDRWDIKATEEVDISHDLETGPLNQRMALMDSLILELLHDRFGLRESKTTRVLSAYELTVAKSGLKAQPADAVIQGFHGLDGPDGHITANGASMTLLVMRMGFMPEVQRHPIVDHTGLTGEYSWKLNWTPELTAPTAENSDLPGLFEALKQQLGLQLVSAKTAVPAIQVDSISKPSPD